MQKIFVSLPYKGIQLGFVPHRELDREREGKLVVCCVYTRIIRRD